MISYMFHRLAARNVLVRIVIVATVSGLFSLLGAPLAEAGVQWSPLAQPAPRTNHCGYIVCSSGHSYPTCTRNGYPINYFVNPCWSEWRAGMR